MSIRMSIFTYYVFFNLFSRHIPIYFHRQDIYTRRTQTLDRDLDDGSDKHFHIFNS